MQIHEGRAYNNGISFWAFDEKETFYITSMRKTDGEVYTRFEKSVTHRKNIKWRFISVISIAIYLLFAHSLCKNYANVLEDSITTFNDFIFTFILIASAYLIYFLYMLCYTVANEEMLKYHFAGHSVLNYYKKNQKMPTTLQELTAGSYFIVTCEYNLISASILLYSLLLLAFILFEPIWAKIVCSLISIVITMFFMKNEKIHILQRAILRYPSYKEYEVVLQALEQYENLQKGIINE